MNNKNFSNISNDNNTKKHENVFALPVKMDSDCRHLALHDLKALNPKPKELAQAPGPKAIAIHEDSRIWV